MKTLREHLCIHEFFIVEQITKVVVFFLFINTTSSPYNHMLWLSIRIASAYDFMEKISLFIVLIPTPDFPFFYQGILLEGVECYFYMNCFTFDGINLNRALVIIVSFPTKYSNKKVCANDIGKYKAL